MKVIVSFDYPPIPIRTMDWSAHFDGYDEPGCPIGRGATPEEAIEDLKQATDLHDALADQLDDEGITETLRRD